MSSFAKFFTLPVLEQRDVVEATLCLIIARLLLLMPFRWLVRFSGRPHPGGVSALPLLSDDQSSSVFAVRRAMFRAFGRLPWDSSCLVCALAAQMMLKRRHLPSVLQLGVRAGAGKELCAHAWLKCGEVNVVG